MSELDKLDLAIIAILQKDSRKPFTEIGRELGVSDATIHIRTKKLENSGVIRGYTIHVAPSKISGPVGAVVLVGVAPGHLQDLAKQLAEIEQVGEVLEIHGEYEIMLRVYSDNLETLRNLVTEKIRTLPGVKATTVFYIFKSWKET